MLGSALLWGVARRQANAGNAGRVKLAQEVSPPRTSNKCDIDGGTEVAVEGRTRWLKLRR